MGKSEYLGLRAGKSLLPAGITRIDGVFERGDAVIIRGPDGAEIGRGLVAYDAGEADKIKVAVKKPMLSNEPKGLNHCPQSARLDSVPEKPRWKRRAKQIRAWQ